MSEMIHCRGCDKLAHYTARSCPHCGAIRPNKMGGKKERLTTALLAFFLGAFGAHRFYLGQIGLGLLYLLLFWTFIPYIVSFIEFILLLCMSEEEFHERYNLRRPDE